MTEPLLECRNVRKEFGGLVAVNDVNLRVERGRVHSIIGPNGAGKTTLMNLISGIYKPTRGEVLFKGQPITHLPLHRRAHLASGAPFRSPTSSPT